MVLIFVKTPEGQTISLDIKFNATVKYLKKLISRSLEISSKRQKLIFGGQLLQNEETLDKYNIQKECTIQLITSNNQQQANSLSSSLNMSPIRQPHNDNKSDHNDNNIISPYLQFGDLILVQLIEAKELKKCDFWRQSSDPYVILAVDNFTTKSKIIKKNINPKWNEMFCFVIDSNNINNINSKNIHNAKQLNDINMNNIGKRIKKKIPKNLKKKSADAGSTNNNDNLLNHSDINIDGNAGELRDNIEVEHILSFLVFDHDRFTPDNFLGSTEISLSLIAYDSIIDLWIPLNHIETGHLHIRIRKCSLSSPMHRSIVFKLMCLGRSITVSDLQEKGISLDQLVGNEAWIHGSDNLSNPALQHLVSVLLLNKVESGHDILWKSNSLKRIQSILSSQHMLPTSGNPTRYVWVSGLPSTNQNSLFQLIKQYVVPKRVYIHYKNNNLLSFALIEFKSIRDAVFIFITLQHKKIQNTRILLGFGRRLIFDKPFLSNVNMAGFLSIYQNNNNVNYNNNSIKWRLCWCFLKGWKLYCFQNLQSDKCLCIIHLKSSLICYTSLQSIEIIKDNTSYFVYNHNKHEMSYWLDAFHEISDKPEAGGMDEDELKHDDDNDNDASILSLADVSIPEELSDTDILLECGKCKNNNSLNNMLSPDCVSYFCCILCLRNDILSKLDITNLEYLSSNYSIQDFIELLCRDELSSFLDLKLRELLESADHFIECPSCHSKWEFVAGDNDNDAPDFSREIGINNKLLSEEGQRHYLSHRVCCRQCNKNFCRSCNKIPYHCGFNCKLYEIYLSADKCRFCATALMPNEIGLNPPSEALKLVCNNEICLEKRELSCRKSHTDCGHPCGGTLNEQYCMSCIETDCKFKRIHITQEPDDYCNICFTEELSEAPCIELDCGHIFHYQCIKKRLQIAQYYDTASVNFSYVQCPLCKMKISHNSLLNEELAAIQSLYRDLEQRAYNQLQEDGLLKSNQSSIKSESKSIMSYAMKRYAFYYCNICKKPYYGGLQQCRDIAQGLNVSDFVCSPCSGIGEEKCKVHGKDYMLYKCKFCCNVASYFCWGNTHFCIDCHKKQENHDFMTTKSKKDLPQCLGAEECPLGLQHPPNGEEFSIGCSLCRGTEFFIRPQIDNPPQANHNNENEEKINDDK